MVSARKTKTQQPTAAAIIKLPKQWMTAGRPGLLLAHIRGFPTEDEIVQIAHRNGLDGICGVFHRFLLSSLLQIQHSGNLCIFHKDNVKKSQICTSVSGSINHCMQWEGN